MNYIDLYKNFIQLEREIKAFDKQTQEGLYWWDIVRYSVFSELNNTIVREYKPAVSLRKNKIKHVFNILKTVYNDIIYILLNRNKKYLFLLYSRIKNKDGLLEDPISDNYLNLISNDSFLIESTFNINTKLSHYDNTLLLLMKKILPKKSYKIDNQIFDQLRSKFKVNIDFEKLVDDELSNYYYSYLYYTVLLKVIKPEICFIIQNGIQKAFFSAANDLSIKTIELQHCQANNTHIMYAYPDNINYTHVSTFPNTFFTYSNFWNQVNYPVKHKISMGKETRNNNLHNNNNNNNIVFIFANIYTENMLYIAKRTARKISPDKVIIKLHPNQENELLYITKEMEIFSNVDIIYTEESLHSILYRVSSIVMIQSTSIYEALQNHVKVFLYKKQDYNTHSDLFDNNNVYLIDSEKKILEKYKDRFIIDDTDSFFDIFDDKLFLNFLSKDQSI